MSAKQNWDKLLWLKHDVAFLSGFVDVMRPVVQAMKLLEGGDSMFCRTNDSNNNEVAEQVAEMPELVNEAIG